MAIHCPNCNRYVGPVETCPYCRAKVAKRSVHQAIKYGSLAFALLGLVLVQQLAVHQGTPQFKISEIDKQNNFAHIEIRGMVSDPITYFSQEGTDSGSLYIEVDDGTGTVTVRTYSDMTSKLLKAGKVPAFGDRVIVTAQVAYRCDALSLLLQSTDDIEIDRATPVDLEPSDIAAADEDSFAEGDRVRVSGRLDEWTDYEWAISLWITDGSQNRANIYIPQSIMDLTGAGVLGRLYVNMELTVVGALKWYEAGRYSRWEVIPASTADMSEGTP